MTTIAPHYVDRLNSIRERTSAARDRVAKARHERDAAVARAKATSSGLPAPGSPEAMALVRADDEYRAAERELDALREEQTFVLSQISGVAGALRSDTFLSNVELLGRMESLAHSSQPIGRMDLGLGVDAQELLSRIQSGDWGVQRMAAGPGLVTPTGSMRASAYHRIVSAPRRPLRLLDLIPSQPMTGASFTYSQEVVVTTEAAAETPEGDIKPASQIDCTDAEVRARTIPHWTKLPRGQLADVPTLQTAVESRLIYGVLRRIEDQIIGGDGQGENLTGILATAGIASVAFDAATPVVELSLEAIVDVIASDATPTAAVVSASDYYLKMLPAKASGSGECLGGGPFGAAPPMLWNLPAIPSRAIAPGKALIGDFANGCTLFVREGVNVRMSDSDQDDFVRNRVTLLGEGRFGLAIWSPASFAEVELEASAP